MCGNDMSKQDKQICKYVNYAYIPVQALSHSQYFQDVTAWYQKSKFFDKGPFLWKFILRQKSDI